jgi:hypothetical protein
MADPCPVCQRPRLVLPFNAETDVTPCWGEGGIGCLRQGVTIRDALIAENVAALKQRDELLARARDLLVGVHAGLTEAIERLPEVEGG